MSVDRRKLMAAGGLVFFAGGGTGAHGAEITPLGAGLTIMIHRSQGKWLVCVPDHDAVSEPWRGKAPEATFILPVKWMPLDEFLSTFEESVA